MPGQCSHPRQGTRTSRPLKALNFDFRGNHQHLNHVIVTHLSLVLHVMDPAVPTRLESSPFDDCQVMDIRSFFEGKPPTSSQGSSSQKGGSKTPNKKTTTPQKNSKKRKSRVIGNDAFY